MATNLQRAAWAETGLRAFANETGQHLASETRDVVVDFLVNLLHFCDASGIDYNDCLPTVAMHYNAETTGEEL